VKQYDELLISILLLLLILPICLGMCPSVPTHIHPYMSKLRMLLETNNETNRLCLQWVSYIPGITAQNVPLLIRNLPQGESGAEGLICMSWQELVTGVATHPVEHLEAHK